MNTLPSHEPAASASGGLFRRLCRVAGPVYRRLRDGVFLPLADGLIMLGFRLRLAVESRGWRTARCVIIDGGRIGPLAERADAALRIIARDEHSKTWFGLVGEICNPALGRIINAHLPLIVAPTVYRSLIRVRSRTGRYPGFVFERPFADYDVIFERAKSTLDLPTDLRNHAEEELLWRHGLPPDAWFVAFHARDEAYLQSVRSGRDWSYHSYRNSSIEDCRSLADLVGWGGGKSVRIGAAAHGALGADWGPSVIDYAASRNDPELDVYLLARCRFAVIGGGSGIGFVAQAFGRPVIWTNFIPVFPWPWCADDLFVPKLLRRREDGRLLTFAELQELGYFARTAGMGDAAFFRDRCLDVVDNDPEDIAGAAREMLARLNGEPPAPELAELQAEFRRRFKPGRPNGSNISADFLARHRDLL